MIKSLVCISAGASCGAILRWMLAVALNAVFPSIPLGTLAANLLGGYLIGFAMSALSVLPALDPGVRLFAVTGFLGGLTTFSAFTAEIGTLLQEQRIVTAVAAVALHVCGSLIMLFLGMGSFAFFRFLVRAF